MYSLLDSISEFSDRFSLIIVGGLMGILVIALIWSKLPKPEFRLRKTKTKYKAQIKPKIVTPKKRHPTIRRCVVITGICLAFAGIFIGDFLGINYLIFMGIGLGIYNFGLWVL